MKEEHIQFPGLACDDNLFLTAEIGKSVTKFQKESGELPFELRLQFFFLVSFLK